MFLKEKYTADGMFEKLKSRLVAGGHLQDRDVYNNGASPTASTSSVFILTAIAARQNRAVATVDFPGAFLNSDMPLTGDHVVYMRLNKQLTAALINIDATYNKYINNNGTCIVKLKKALYGCVESAKLWSAAGPRTEGEVGVGGGREAWTNGGEVEEIKTSRR